MSSKQEFLVSLQEVMDELPGEAGDLVRRVVDGVTQRLGESPEAWRGAVLIITQVIRILMLGREDGDDMTTNEMMLATLMPAIAATPWGQMAMDAASEEER